VATRNLIATAAALAATTLAAPIALAATADAAGTSATGTTTTSTTGTPSPSAPRTELTAQQCSQSEQQWYRTFSVTAVMRPITGTERLAINFELLQKLPGTGVYTQLSGPGLGDWVSPSDPPTLGQLPGDVWYVRHPVADLAAPARYKFEVLFRWFGAHGKVLRTTTKDSELCVQHSSTATASRRLGG
jgi:hypothetical protein